MFKASWEIVLKHLKPPYINIKASDIINAYKKDIYISNDSPNKLYDFIEDEILTNMDRDLIDKIPIDPITEKKLTKNEIKEIVQKAKKNKVNTLIKEDGQIDYDKFKLIKIKHKYLFPGERKKKDATNFFIEAKKYKIQVVNISDTSKINRNDEFNFVQLFEKNWKTILKDKKPPYYITASDIIDAHMKNIMLENIDIEVISPTRGKVSFKKK